VKRRIIHRAEKNRGTGAGEADGIGAGEGRGKSRAAILRGCRRYFRDGGEAGRRRGETESNDSDGDGFRRDAIPLH